MDNGSTREGKIREVNLSGLSVEPAHDVQVGDRLSMGFDGYPDVSPAFTLVGRVRRILADSESGAPSAIGIEIDRNATSAGALQNYRRVVLHYLHHRPLLEDMDKGYFEGRCTKCDWVGRVGERTPCCSRCGADVVPV
jgi:hypothetical protein